MARILQRQARLSANEPVASLNGGYLGLSNRAHRAAVALKDAGAGDHWLVGDAVVRRCGAHPCRPTGCEDDGEQLRRGGVQVAERKRRSSAPLIVHEVLRGPWAPLPSDVRTDMGARFGRDFGDVRLHTDSRAAQSAEAVNATAYTVGTHVVLGRSMPSLASWDGRRLLAHELVHVIQGSTTSTRTTNLSVSSPADPSEREAEMLSLAALKQETGALPPLATQPPVHGMPVAGVVQRQAAPAPAVAPPQLSQEMLRQIVEQLRRAMAGLGTDEEAIYSALAGRTQDEVDAIARVYQQVYGRLLIDDLRDELTSSEMEHLAVFSPTAAPGATGTPAQQAQGLAEMVALQLKGAMEGLGTDEESIIAALSGRSATERQAIRAAYTRLTRRELETDLRDELSGSDLIAALALLRQGQFEPEDDIKIAVAGPGTDEERLFAALDGIKGSRATIAATIARYSAKGYGDDMLADIRGDLSFSDLDRAMELLHGLTPSGTCSPDDRDRGLEAISVAISMAQVAVAKLNADIARGRLSGEVHDALAANFNPGGAPGAVSVQLAAQIVPILTTALNELLMASQINCGPVAPCTPTWNCYAGFTAAWTNPTLAATVQICPAFFDCSSDDGTTILHEFVHHTGIREQRPTGVYHGTTAFSQLVPSGNGSATDSLHNADAFAYFCKDLY